MSIVQQNQIKELQAAIVQKDQQIADIEEAIDQLTKTIHYNVQKKKGPPVNLMNAVRSSRG